MSCLRKNILLEVIKIPLFILKCATEQITHFNNFLMYLVFNADRIPVNGEVSLQVAAGVFHGRDKSF